MPHLDTELTHQGHQRLFRTFALPLLDAVISCRRFLTAIDPDPRRLAEDFPQTCRTLPGNTALAIVRFATLVTAGAQAQVGGDLASIVESGQIAHFGEKCHRHQAAHAWNFSQFTVRVLVSVDFRQAIDRFVQLVLFAQEHFVAIQQALQFRRYSQVHYRQDFGTNVGNEFLGPS